MSNRLTPTPLCRRSSTARACGAYLALAIGATALTATPAWADDDDAVKPAPRTAVEIDGASVVLIAANNQLYAFVDRIDDNAPVADAELTVDLADGTSLALTKAAGGMFVAPFNRTGHMHDAFMVSLHSKQSNGDVPAEIGYDDVPDAAASPVTAPIRTKLSISVVSAMIGAFGAALAMRWFGWRRRSLGRPAVAGLHRDAKLRSATG